MTLYAVDYSGLQAGNTALISGAGTIGALTVLSLNAARASQIFVAKPNPAINQLMQERARVVEEVSRLQARSPQPRSTGDSEGPGTRQGRSAAAKELGQNALTFRADVLDSKAREVLFAPIKERFGHLDIVFANAGIAKIGSIEETSETMFDEVLRTNLTGVLLTIQAALPLLRPGSSIFLNGSIGATTGAPGFGSFPAVRLGFERWAGRSQQSFRRAESVSMSWRLVRSKLQMGARVLPGVGWTMSASELWVAAQRRCRAGREAA